MTQSRKRELLGQWAEGMLGKGNSLGRDAEAGTSEQ